MLKKTLERFNKLNFKQVFVPVLFLCIVANVIAGTTGKIAGRAIDTSTGEPLIGANVFINTEWQAGEQVRLNNPKGGATDIEGDYYILNLRPGFYDITISTIGYRSETREHVRVDVDKTTQVNFSLQLETLEGQEIFVTAQRSDRIELDQTSTRQLYMIEDIEEVAGISDVSDIMQLQADVVDNNIRGGREGESLYLINGATIVNPISNRRAFTPMAMGLQQVEVITSGFSAEYGNAQSGVINMVPKEGSDKWIVRTDVKGTLPHDRYWGGNYYDPEKNNPFYIFTSGPDQWLDPSPNDSSQAYFNDISPNWEQYMPPDEEMSYADSLKYAELAYKQFLGYARDLGWDNSSRTDYNINISAGGPITSKSRIFISGKQQVKHQKLPTVWPDLSRQLMVNLTNRLSSTDKLNLTVNYFNGFTNGISYGKTVPYLFELEHTNVYHTTQVVETGLRWEHIFSPEALSEWNVRILQTEDQDNIATREPDVYMIKNANAYITKYQAPGGIENNIFANQRGSEQSTTFTLSGSYSNQINKHILAKFGLQYFGYDMQINKIQNITDPNNVSVFDFKAQPFEGAFYTQNKLEFQGMIANLGLRLDFYDFNTEYFSDIYSPLRNPDFDPDPSIPYSDREPYYNFDKAERTEASKFSRLQPRIGIAYPVSENTVVHLNYGTFTQRPDFTKIYDNFVVKNMLVEQDIYTVNRLGNPRLRPEKTIAYDLGFIQGLKPFHATLEISAYYKDVKDLVQHVYYEDETGNLYETFANREYADIKGFHVNVERHSGQLKTVLRYNYQVATGKSATPFDANIKYIENPDDGELPVELPDPEDILLDYDRTHRLVSNISYRTPRKSGLEIIGIHPFAEINVNLRYTYQTGRPYTYDTEGLGLKNNERTPDYHDLKLRIQKSGKIGRERLTVYFEVLNLLNQKDWAYSLFSKQDGYAVTRWHEEGEEAALLFGDYSPLNYRQELAFLRNSPRYYKLGLIFSL